METIKLTRTSGEKSIPICNRGMTVLLNLAIGKGKTIKTLQNCFITTKTLLYLLVFILPYNFHPYAVQQWNILIMMMRKYCC